MTTTDISFDPALHAHKEADAWQVLDLVLYQQIGTFSALEIAQVAELLPSWISHNIVAITNARADDTRDWYFPVYTRKAIPTHTRTSSSSWSGIHHLAENHASATVHPLPPLPAVPPTWRVSTIVASAGGLLLLMPPVCPVPSSENGNVVRPCRACGRVGSPHERECWMNCNDWGRMRTRLTSKQSKVPQDWKPLLVWNPLTQTWRELPVAANGVSRKWRYDEVLIDMIVDEPANSYTIVMAFRKSFCMCIYTSTSNAWVYQDCKLSGNRETAWKSQICANAVVRGRLHYVHLQYRPDAPTVAVLRVFEIKEFEETGKWKPCKEYALQVRVWGFSEARIIRFRIGREAVEVIRYLGLVECMGDMYAVIPTREDEMIISKNSVAQARALVNARVNAHRSREEGFVAMPVQFHILGLHCENRLDDVNEVLRIQVPQGRSDIPLRRMSLMEKTSVEYLPFWNWFSCTAKGSVIWVACEDYLLQYDVISGQSKTQIIRKPRSVGAGVCYRPSFHMKP